MTLVVLSAIVVGVLTSKVSTVVVVMTLVVMTLVGRIRGYTKDVMNLVILCYIDGLIYTYHR